MIERLNLTSVLQTLSDPEQPFTFSRWGDGEWKSVLGRHKKGASNCDGHAFYPQMGHELKQVLVNKPNYMLGMQHFALRLYGPSIYGFLDKNKLLDLKWYESDVFHYGAIKGHREEILDVVRQRKLLVVGPPHLKAVKSSGLPYWKFIGVPPKNCYLNLQEIYRHIVAEAEGQQDPLLISLSASMPAEILCDRLYERFGDRHTIIDFGSLWDPLVGKFSRSYMRAQSKQGKKK